MLGEKIRNVRKNKNIKLKEIAERTELSSSYISQVERNLIEPSISSLRKISLALEVPIHEFLIEDEKKGILIKKENRIKFELPNSNIKYEFITPTKIKNESPNFQLIHMEVEPFTWSPLEYTRHTSADECIIVEEGEIEVYLEEEKYNLTKGDSLYIQKNTAHKMYNRLEYKAEIIICMSPPIY